MRSHSDGTLIPPYGNAAGYSPSPFENQPSCQRARPDDLVGKVLLTTDPRVALSGEEERSLGWRIVNEGCSTSRDRMVLANRRLVATIAANYVGRGIDCLDLIEQGNRGLIHAAESFDPAQGARFSTWASWWIKQAMKIAVTKAKRSNHVQLTIPRSQ